MLVMGAKLQTWMTLAPLNVGFGADVGANRRGGLPDLLGGLESEFLAGDHRLGGRVEFVGDVAQVVGVFAMSSVALVKSLALPLAGHAGALSTALASVIASFRVSSVVPSATSFTVSFAASSASCCASSKLS